jgi:hypothetical protein
VASCAAAGGKATPGIVETSPRASRETMNTIRSIDTPPHVDSFTHEFTSAVWRRFTGVKATPWRTHSPERSRGDASDAFDAGEEQQNAQGEATAAVPWAL